MDNDILSILNHLGKYLKTEKKQLIITIILILITTIISIFPPLLLGIAVDQIIANKNLRVLLFICGILFMFYLLNSIITWITNRIMIKSSENIMYKIRKDLFNKIENLSLEFFDTNKIGDIMSIFTNDISLIGEVITESLISIINSFITLIGVTIIIFIINIPLAITTIITIPMFFIAILIIGKKSGKYFDKQQKQIGMLSAYSEEIISGIKAIKSLNVEDKFIKKFNSESEKLRDTTIKSNTYGNLLISVNLAITNISNILLIVVGSILVIKGETTIGSILMFLNYSSMFRSPINDLATIFSGIVEGLSGAKRIFKIIDADIIVKDEGNLKLDDLVNDIEFNHVFFGYDKENTILKDICLKVKKGETLAIVGETGSGKTTLINLLMRFYDIDSGQLLINGINIKDLKKEELRKKISIVLQDNYLFKGSILDNIKFGLENSNMNKIIEVSKKSGAHNFIHRLPNGYQTLVEEGGSNFSSGEKQLIAITRAMLYNSEILILDEATSDIDTKTELLCQKGIKELMKGRTSIIIAHRLSTIVEADKIIVIDKGKIVEQGKHIDLIKEKKQYYKLYMSQFY